ncbi:Acyl dehydratase [Cribrihabitans marinus]|uniref:Acyl dehydratase n=1 Tax=Cribrihabitans marinus TaxID=1227549 RepID=A0A1H6W3T6_9RHOB|nr:MaoC family dehydratase [Cribrihabitans marinus]GGH24708.1 acyl dehydratase [Cribrihabitans marinus]SEJ11608.1 Acyl dehydratase [Cribrihabitans marinus]
MTGRVLPPGRHGLADLAVGDTIRTASRRITAQMIDAFAELSGDRFEIHMDAGAARRHGFPDRVAHGLLVLSVVDGLKNRTPAQFAAIASLGWDWQFKAPVLAGDEIRATITVTHLRPTSDGARGIATLGFTVTNQAGATVQTGTNRLMIYA